MAATLYPDDAPNDFQPVTCYGDGNCLFRAFSMIFFGNEDHHTEFRIRAVCELVKNEKNYLSNDYLHSLTGVNKVVENLLPSSVVVNAKDFSSSYRRDILRTLQPFTFAHMWHIFSWQMFLAVRFNPCILMFRTLEQTGPFLTSPYDLQW